jgi:hypothetical protein
MVSISVEFNFPFSHWFLSYKHSFNFLSIGGTTYFSVRVCYTGEIILSVELLNMVSY